MKPWGHLLASLPLTGVLFWGTGKIESSLAGAAVSVLMDLDHLPDYLAWRKSKAGIRDFFHQYFHHKTPVLMLFLHSWEWLPLAAWLLWMTAGTEWSLAIMTGWLYHMVWDQATNPVGAGFYFFTRRAAAGFRRSELLASD